MPPTTWAEIRKLIAAIPEGVCGGPQPEYLYHLARKSTGKGAIVEIGTYVGKSTIAMGFAQKEKNGPPINSVDIKEHADVVANLERAGVSQFVKRILCESTAQARQWRQPIELLFIDADHSYRAVRRDIRAWSGLVMPGGLMAFHDYYPNENSRSGVGRAVFKEVLTRGDQWRIYSDREAGSIIVFERLSHASA